MPTINAGARAVVILGLAVLVSGLSCKREERGLRVQPPAAQTTYAISTTDFHAGPTTEPTYHVINEYDQNAFAINQGKLLYLNFNCVGCHFHGGGGIGPPLMDDKWIYGSQPDQIFATILQGRPNGMPSFHGKIPDYQVWQIVAYVRSLSGLTDSQASPGRGDTMHITKPPNSVSPQSPVQTTNPK